MFINRIEFKEDLNPLKKGFSIDFNKRLTILVGDNGVGKSTITDALGQAFGHEDDTYLKRQNKDILDIVKDGEFKVNFIDFHGDDKKFAGAFGKDIGLQMRQQRASSGQVTLSLLNKAGFEDSKNKVIILDEPERGLSIKNQNLLGKLILRLLVFTNCQIILTCHSIIILKFLAEVAQFFSVEKQCDITLSDFLKEQGYELEV